MRFVIATRDYAGLGFGTRLQDEGHEVVLATNPSAEDSENPQYNLVGNAMLAKEPLSELLARRAEMRDWYWVWDSNHSVGDNETLRAEGFKVLAGGQYAYTMEHDRKTCLDHVGAYGLLAPPSHEFENTRDAIDFCRRNRRTAYVYKPNAGANFETFLPECEDPYEANHELQVHLETLENGSFILQERKEGVETNVEVWFYQGEPVFAFMTLESKRKYALDMGELAGCAFDFVWVIPLGCKAVRESIGKLFPAYKSMQYTGFGDANFIAARDGVWFFEKCERFGYNAHPNLLFNLSRRGIGEVLAGLVDGTFKPEFSGGFGASVTMSTKANTRAGNAIQFPSRLRPNIYLWDAYKRGEQYLTSGYDPEGNILIVLEYGYTMPTAWESLMKVAGQIRFPYRHYRADGAGVDYPSSPIRRYEALKAMGYI